MGFIPIIGLIAYILSHLVSAIHVYKETNKNALFAMCEFFDVSLYVGLLTNPQHFTQLGNNKLVEQLYRGYATIESFTMCIVQTFMLVAYTERLTLFEKDSSSTTNVDGWAYVTLTFFSLIFSFLFIIAIFINKDSHFTDVDNHPNVNTTFAFHVSVIYFYLFFWLFPFVNNRLVLLSLTLLMFCCFDAFDAFVFSIE